MKMQFCFWKPLPEAAEVSLAFSDSLSVESLIVVVITMNYNWNNNHNYGLTRPELEGGGVFTVSGCLLVADFPRRIPRLLLR